MQDNVQLKHHPNHPIQVLPFPMRGPPRKGHLNNSLRKERMVQLDNPAQMDHTTNAHHLELLLWQLLLALISRRAIKRWKTKDRTCSPKHRVSQLMQQRRSIKKQYTLLAQVPATQIPFAQTRAEHVQEAAVNRQAEMSDMKDDSLLQQPPALKQKSNFDPLAQATGVVLARTVPASSSRSRSTGASAAKRLTGNTDSDAAPLKAARSRGRSPVRSSAFDYSTRAPSRLPSSSRPPPRAPSRAPDIDPPPPPDAKKPFKDKQRSKSPLAIEDGQVNKKRRQPTQNKNMAPVFGTIAMKNKERMLALEDGVAKRPRRQPKKNPNRATAVDDEIPLHDKEIARPKTSTETGHTKLAIEDKRNTNVAPKMAQPVVRNKIVKDKWSKTQPKVQFKHDTDLDANTSKSYWNKMPKGYIVDQLQKRGARPAVKTLMRESRDVLSSLLLNTYMSLA